MRSRLTVLVLFLSFALYGMDQTDEKLVNQSYEKYTSAILADNPEEAVKYVDSRTIAYYKNIADLVKNGDSATVSALPLIDKITVLTIRAKGTKAEIMPLDGKGLLIYAIKKGMVSKSSMKNNTLGEVTIEADAAKAALVVKGNATPYFIDFHKEQGTWKVDITSLFAIATPVLKQMQEGSGQSENDFVTSMLGMAVGKKVGPEIWQKMNR